MSTAPVRRRTILLAIFAGFTAFLIGASLKEPTFRAFFSPAYWSEMIRIGKVLRLTNTRFVDAEKAAYEKIGRNAALGATASLDRYSEFLDKDSYAEQNRRSDQLFTGIGILMQPVDGCITVEKVFPHGGAEAAGILPGDRIVGAGATDLTGLPLDEAGSKIRGEEGTAVLLRVLRPGETTPRLISVFRRTVTVSTVSESRLLDDGVTALVRIDHFERRTAGELAAAYDALAAKGARRLVLDLRGNPGGLVDAAVEVVGLFTPKDSVVARLAGRTETESETYATPDAPRFPALPLALLVDGNSASASEIVAGAIQDYRRAPLVGARTYGKGIVQSIYPIDDTTGLKLTTAKYMLPQGRAIHGSGVFPDVLVSETLEESGRRAAEEALVKHAGGRDTFIARFGYAPHPDLALDTAVALLDSAKK